MNHYLEMKCEACRADSPAVPPAELESFLREHPGWDVELAVEGLRLRRTYPFKDFAEALDFTNRVGVLAEAEGHHPALLTEWGRVTVSWWTHKIRGIHRNDLVMAARTDRLIQD
jgi:4a-hydroxytetrahydrobiopterin dehydratase